MTNIFAVVGQHRRDRSRFLLAGEDGRYYAWDARGNTTPVASLDEWEIDPEAGAAAPERSTQDRGGDPAPADPTPNRGLPSRVRPLYAPPAIRLVASLALLLTALLWGSAASAHAPALGTVLVAVGLLAEPTSSAAVLDELATGTTVELSGDAEAGFLAVSTAGLSGWVPLDAIDAGGLALATALVPTDLKSAPNAGGDVLGSVPSGATVLLTGAARDGYEAASYAGIGGWIASDAITSAS